MISRILIILFVIAVSLLSASILMAASVTVISTGGNSYAVQGADMGGVARIDLSISYDASSLTSPSVIQGNLVKGAMFLANANIPGTIKVVIITTTPFKENGQIASISFGSQTGSGGVTGVTANLINIKGAKMPVQASVAASSATPPTTAQNASASRPITTSGSSSTAATTMSSYSSALNKSSMPADTWQANVPVPAPVVATTATAKAAPGITQPAKPHEPAATAVKPAVEPAPVQTAHRAVVERFHTYQGVRIPAAMTDLFKQQIANTIRQEPAIVVSNGSTTFRLLVELSANAPKSPNFALSGAKMVSLKKGEDPGKWIVEGVPNKKVVKASVTILQGSAVQEYPITVVPPIAAISGKEVDFAAFLNDNGTKSPKFDLNADGKHDYLDDYIYTAHYLIMKDTAHK